jgi:glutamate-1-semialdehyde 2,1-aminomutase
MNPEPGRNALIREEDHEFFERELAGFVPDKVFDAHCHLWRDEHIDMTGFRPNPAGLPADVGAEEYSRFSDCLHPGRGKGALFIPFPLRRNARDKAHRWIARQAADTDNSRALFWLYPDDDPEWVRDQVRELGLRGLKPYHWMPGGQPHWEAALPDYLPEPLVKVAHEEGWVIMLHMVKSRAVADAANIHWIRNYCERYPNMTLILAHAARGFQPAHNFEGLPQLAGLDNLYCDTAANCEAMAHAAIIRVLGHHKLMYGSDFCVSHMRGRNFAVADSHIWVCEESPVWHELHADIKPVLLGLESLRALKWACMTAELGDNEVEDIFWNNAAAVYGLV